MGIVGYRIEPDCGSAPLVDPHRLQLRQRYSLVQEHVDNRICVHPGVDFALFVGVCIAFVESGFRSCFERGTSSLQ